MIADYVSSDTQMTMVPEKALLLDPGSPSQVVGRSELPRDSRRRLLSTDFAAKPTFFCPP